MFLSVEKGPITTTISSVMTGGPIMQPDVSGYIGEFLPSLTVLPSLLLSESASLLPFPAASSPSDLVAK